MLLHEQIKHATLHYAAEEEKTGGDLKNWGGSDLFCGLCGELVEGLNADFDPFRANCAISERETGVCGNSKHYPAIKKLKNFVCG